MESPRKVAVMDRVWREERARTQKAAARAGLRFAGADELLELAEPSLYARVPRRFLDANRIVPVAHQGRKVLVASPVALAPRPEVEQALGGEVELCLVTPTDFRRLRMALALGQAGRPKATPREQVTEPDDVLAGPPLVAIFEEILLDAIGERASDIHLEQYGAEVRVRLRTDGDLRDIRHYHLGVEQLRGIINIIKVRAKLDIAENRAPQGGRFTVATQEQTFDLRVQTQPAHHGEHVVIRLLPHDIELLTIEQLGFTPLIAATYRQALAAPSGLLLIVGPTGSGKSTTLYAGLEVLAADASRKVITVEDPIEYAVARIQQTQVHPEVGFTFPTAMRSFVREDPDVIMVGEIRDGETALEALRASQTGHLVLTTLHSADTVDAVQRLFDLGMHPNSIAGELLGILAQRLARRVCLGCRERVEPDPALARLVFGGGAPPGFASYRGHGCADCGGHGTFGRVAVAEYLPTGPALRKGVSERLPIDQLRGVALANGLVPMRGHALALVNEGVIPFSELPLLMSLERLQPHRAA